MASISVAHFPCLSHSCFQNELGSGLFKTSGQNCFRSSKILCSFSILKFSSDLQLDGPFVPYLEGHRPWMVQIELSSEIDQRFSFVIFYISYSLQLFYLVFHKVMYHLYYSCMSHMANFEQRWKSQMYHILQIQ